MVRLAPPPQQNGIVAILDALGASTYSDEEIARFMRSREVVIESLNQKAENLRLSAAGITTFTFNDTVLIVYKTKKAPTITELKSFGFVLRKFIIDSLVHRILFRGAFAVGQFYVNDQTNTVMGGAVTDAAAWYDRADWIGINATPKSTIYIQSLVEGGGASIENALIDYDIPLKDGAPIRLRAVNWPKGFFVQGITPCAGNEDKRAKCLSLLAQHAVPVGTEHKYFNSLAFFDYAVKQWREGKEQARQSR